MAAALIKTRQGVADHGEVFTAEREVNAMLDLVKPETERIDSRFTVNGRSVMSSPSWSPAFSRRSLV